MNYNQRLKRTKQIELFTFLIMVIFASCLMIKFQDNCQERRGAAAVIKAPSADILKDVSFELSNN